MQGLWLFAFLTGLLTGLLPPASPAGAAAPPDQPNITFVQTGTNPKGFPIYTGTWAPATAGPGVTNSVTGGVTYGWVDVVASSGLLNQGTFSMKFPGYTADDRDRMTLTVTGGALTNAGTLTLETTNSYRGPLYVYANVTNDPGGVLNAIGHGAVTLGNTAATHLNRGTWTITEATGMTVKGDGTSFTQDAAGAALTASMFLFDNDSIYSYQSASATAVNNFSVTAGSVAGHFTFKKTAVTLGPAAVVSGPTTFQFMGTQQNNTFAGDVPANLTLLASETIGASHGGWVNAIGSFVNDGAILIQTNDGAGFNNANGRVAVNSDGTLTNNGTMTLLMTAPSVYGTNYATFDGHLVNHGTVNVTLQQAASNTRIARFTKADGVYTSDGLFDLNDRANFQVNGSTFSNLPGGVIRNTGAGNGVTATWYGTAVLDNAGTVEVIGGDSAHTFTLSSPLSAATSSGSTLAGGTWRATSNGYATALNVTNAGGGTVTGIGTAGSAAHVVLDGPDASFTQLESTPSLAAIGAQGQLSILGGKVFTSAAALANSGAIVVGGAAGDGSVLKLGPAGTGTLTSTGSLSGFGAVQGNVLAAGTLTPGGSIGPFSVLGDCDLDGTLVVDLDGTSGEADLLGVSGALRLGDGSVLDLQIASALDPAAVYPIATYGSLGGAGEFGTVLNLPTTHELDYVTDNSIRLVPFTAAEIPEPASALLVLAGATLVVRRRRRA